MTEISTLNVEVLGINWAHHFEDETFYYHEISLKIEFNLDAEKTIKNIQYLKTTRLGEDWIINQEDIEMGIPLEKITKKEEEYILSHPLFAEAMKGEIIPT